MPNKDFPDPFLTMFHDDDVEVYFDGVLAAKAAGYDTVYEERPIMAEAKATLKPGRKIVVAVHCHQNNGGQYIDVGVGAVEPAKPAEK